MGLQYHLLQPETSTGINGAFREFQTIDFVLNGDGRKLVKNSIVLTFQLRAYSDAYTTRVTTAQAIGIEPKIGGHAFIGSYTTEVQSAGIIESIQEVPRYVNTVWCCSKDQNDVYSAKAQAEGREVRETGGRYRIQGVRSGNSDTNAASFVTNDQDFAIVPPVCFNNMSGDDYSFSKKGYVRISMNLAKNADALFGLASATASYEIVNPQIRYTTIDDDGSQSMIMMNTYSMIKNTINSQQGNISATIPQSRVSGVVVNFLSQNNESSATANHYRLEKMPQLKSVQYLFNNSTNDAVSYVEEDLQTMVSRGVAAVSSSIGKGSFCSPNKLAANKANVIGLPFEDFIDLSRSKFNVQLVSDSPNLGNEPRIAYLYFLALIQM